MGFFVENTGNLKWQITKGDTLYNISKRLHEKSGESVTVGNETSFKVLDLKEIKTSGSSTKQYQIIAEEIRKQNKVSPNKLKIGQIIDVPDQFDVAEGRYSSLYSLTEPTTTNNTTKKEEENLVSGTNLSSTKYGSGNLKLGSRGEFVTNLQNDLIKLNKGGSSLTKPTGYFGTTTKAIIIQFQGEKRLPADGIVGPRTKEAILNEMKTLQEPESE